MNFKYEIISLCTLMSFQVMFWTLQPTLVDLRVGLLRNYHVIIIEHITYKLLRYCVQLYVKLNCAF